MFKVTEYAALKFQLMYPSESSLILRVQTVELDVHFHTFNSILMEHSSIAIWVLEPQADWCFYDPHISHFDINEPDI